jgi:lipopolysaccharide export system protein LptA
VASIRTARRLVGGLLLLGLAYAGYLLAHMGRRPSVPIDTMPLPPGQTPKRPEDETGCFDDLVLDWSGDRLEAGKACKQPDGSSALERVVLHLRADDGTERLSVHAATGRLPDKEGAGPIRLEGDVHVESPQGLRVDAPALDIDNAKKVVEGKGSVSFAQGDLSGRAGSLRHDWKNDRTELFEDPLVTLEGKRAQGRVVTLRGVAIEHDGKLRIVRATGGAILDFGDGSVVGDVVEVFLAPEQDRVSRIVATGEAQTRVDMAAAAGVPGPAMRRTLTGARIDHEFAEGGQLDAVTAEGGARLVGQQVSDGPVGESLDADTLTLDFDPAAGARLLGVTARGAPAHFERHDGVTHREVTGQDLALSSGQGNLDHLVVIGDASLKDDGPGGHRALSAEQADMTLSADGQRLDDLTFHGKPGRLEEDLASPQGPVHRVVVAREGRLQFDADGRPKSGTLDGEVDLTEGGSRARGKRARLSTSPRQTILEGDASVESGGRIAHGDEVTRDEDSGTLTVKGNQHTLVRDARMIPGMEAGNDEPILISADTLVIDERAHRATYEGGRPALHRGDAELVADRIVIDDAAGTLDADGDVKSKLRLAPPGSGAPDAVFDPTRLVDGASQRLRYVRAERLVSYEGVASLSQETTVLHADRVDIRLKEGGQQVETLHATGDASFVSPARGEAEGHRIEYRGADGTFLVEGRVRPARARDAKGNLAIGALVEMTRDNVRVVGTSEGRTRGSTPVPEAATADKGPQP